MDTMGTPEREDSPTTTALVKQVGFPLPDPALPPFLPLCPYHKSFIASTLSPTLNDEPAQYRRNEIKD